MADSDLNEINRTLGSVLAELTNLKEDLRDHRTDASGRNQNTIDRLDNAAMRLGKLEAQIADIAPEVGTLKKLRERGVGIVSAVGLIGIGVGAVGSFAATHWGFIVKAIAAVMPK